MTLIIKTKPAFPPAPICASNSSIFHRHHHRLSLPRLPELRPVLILLALAGDVRMPGVPDFLGGVRVLLLQLANHRAAQRSLLGPVQALLLALCFGFI